MLFTSVEAGYHLFTCEEASSEVDQLLINTQPVHIVKVSICLFDLILYFPSTIFQLNRDGSSWVEQVLS